MVLRFGVDVDAVEDVGVLRLSPLTEVDTIEMLSSGPRSFSSLSFNGHRLEFRRLEGMVAMFSSVCGKKQMVDERSSG